MSQASRARALRELDAAALADWSVEQADRVADCGRCGREATLREVVETRAYECRPCWDRDVLGPRDDLVGGAP